MSPTISNRAGRSSGLRTATHAFDIPGKTPYSHYSAGQRRKGLAGRLWPACAGRNLGQSLERSHDAKHARSDCPGVADNPILRGIKDGEIWVPTDVYEVRLPMLPDVKPLILGQVLTGMKPTDPPLQRKPAIRSKNNPMMPIAWTKPYTGTSGKTAQNFCTTMGASVDLENEALRRLLVNAAYWCVGLEDKIPEKANVDLVGEYHPTFYRLQRFQKGRETGGFERRINLGRRAAAECHWQAKSASGFAAPVRLPC